MDGFLGSIGGFNAILVFCVLVFVHEMGHYLVARRCGVRVETFSIGFWKEIYGWTDRHGTRWKIGLIPLGGYVKMFGEHSVEEGVNDGKPREMTAAEKAVSFSHKSLGQRTAIVAAGPAANFLFAIAVLAVLFATIGRPQTKDFAEYGIGSVRADSAAERAGLLPGDRILSVDGKTILEFEDLRQAVLSSDGREMFIKIDRDGEEIDIQARPDAAEGQDGEPIYLLGVTMPLPEFVSENPLSAVVSGVTETWRITTMTLTAVGEIIVGSRSVDEMGGPVKIVQMSGEVAQLGWVSLIGFTAVLSVNLGLLNLFPIPMLDGGHLLFYAFEAVLKRPLKERTQEYAMRIGLALLLTLMVFITVNDIIGPQISLM